MDWLRRLIAEHGDWNRKRLAQELCRQWGWRNGQGVWKDFAARSFLLKHYLGLHVGGENVRYLAQAAQGRDLACVLFGAAAWKCEPRDRHLSITEAQRQAGLQMVANNTRFLVLPWVRVPGLASHVLGQVVRRIAADWQAKYGHGLHWLETFVARGRFAGRHLFPGGKLGVRGADDGAQLCGPEPYAAGAGEKPPLAAHAVADERGGGERAGAVGKIGRAPSVGVSGERAMGPGRVSNGQPGAAGVGVLHGDEDPIVPGTGK